MKDIPIRIKTVYGMERIYVTDATTARLLQSLTRKATIDRVDIKNLEELGHTFKVEQMTL